MKYRPQLLNPSGVTEALDDYGVDLLEDAQALGLRECAAQALLGISMQGRKLRVVDSRHPHAVVSVFNPDTASWE